MRECIFCQKYGEEILFENQLAKAFYDTFPVNKGHILIVPKEHKKDYFELNHKELFAIDNLLFNCKKLLEKEYQAESFNIGWNCGQVAGQTIFHAHCHLIPRYSGDVESPKGGIRNFKEPIVKY